MKALTALFALVCFGAAAQVTSTGTITDDDSAEGALWDGLLAEARAYDWTTAGIPGGIPTRTTVCGSVSSGATRAQIQAVIDTCEADEVLQFGAGTYTLSTDFIFSNVPIVFRGMGTSPGDTTITLGADTGIFCGASGDGGLGGEPPADETTWTGGLTRASTVLTVGSTTGMVAGQTIILDEENPAWVFPDGEDGTQDTGRNDNPVGFYNSTERAFSQTTKIVSVDSSTQITIKDPVSYTHTAGLNPKVFFWAEGAQDGNIEYCGVENLHIDANGNDNAISLTYCDYCWVKNVWLEDIGRAGVLYRWSYGGELRDSYIDSNSGGAPTEYGIEIYNGGSHLIENNILFNVTTGILPQTASGVVYGYNYIHNTVAGTLFPSYTTHLSHNSFQLLEGNDANKIEIDNVWGSASHMTLHRNRARGTGDNKTDFRNPVGVHAHQRFVNIVLNVLGDSSHHVEYQCDENNLGVDTDEAIYENGFWNNCPTINGTNPYDSTTITSMMRWGNWDADTNNVRYCTAPSTPLAACSLDERGDDDPTFPALSNPITSDFAPSFYHDSEPSFFGAVPWPPIGPDVTCASNCVPNAGGHAHKIPARVCYEASTKDGSGFLTDFDADDCY